MKTYWPEWTPVPNWPWRVIVLKTGKYVRDKEGKAHIFRTSKAAFTFIEKLEKKKKV